MNIHNLIQELDKRSTSEIPDFSAELLVRPGRWKSQVGAYLETLDNNKFVSLVSKSYVPSVEPEVFMLYDDPAGRFQLVLGHFDRTRFDHYQANGTIGPHHHHFTFTTRILAGSYQHVLYENAGTLARPQLKVQAAFTCQKGDVYTLAYDWFHEVMEPQHHTMSLMIRGSTEHLPTEHPMHLTAPQIHKHRELLRALLSQPESRAAGTRINLQEMCKLSREMLES